MTTATDLPLLALLGKANEVPDKALAAAGDDDRALDAALEFATLLLDAGVTSGRLPDAVSGKVLPDTGGKPLPGSAVPAGPIKPPEDAVPAGVLEPNIRRGLPGDLGGAVVDQIKTAQAQPAVLQRTRADAPEALQVAAARQPAADAPVAVTDTEAVVARGAESAPGLAALARAEAARRSSRAPADAARGVLDAVSALRAGAAATLPREGAAPSATPSAPVPQLAGPDAMLGETGWTRQFAERVGWVIQARVPQAQLSLNPEHLGPIEMSIEVEDAQARVQFTAAHAVTREAIEQSLPRLREMLEQQGLDLAQADVGADPNTARRDGAGDRDAERDLGAAPARAADADAENEDGPVAAEPLVRLRPRGLVDTFV